MSGTLSISPLTGPAVTAALGDLARLRIDVFRAWPYLYAGSEAYEARYLAAYAVSPGAIVVAARDGPDGPIVGMATAAPLEDHAPEFAQPLAAQGIAARDVLYLGESVLLPRFRGQGAGHAFFDLREAHGAALGRPICAFCAVQRPPDHPLRDPAHRPLDPFWHKRGYAPVPGMVGRFAWQDLGEEIETEKPMQVWLRRSRSGTR
ncbi:MAG: GNAT family N-acetyltransferase [Pseudomonadota bacterium]